MKAYVDIWSYLAHFFLEREMFQTNLFRKSKHTFCVQWPPPPQKKSCRLWDNGTAGQATDDNMAHALCMMDN
jgi:hypothetical protein